MNFEQFIYSLSDTGALPLETIIFRFIIATILGVIVALVSYFTYKNHSNNYYLFVSQIILTMTSSLIIIVIGNNIARAFGIMGALNLVRFSTRVISPKDNALLFFCIVIGMTCGSGYIIIALTGVLLVSFVLFILKITNLFNIDIIFVEFDVKDIDDARIIMEDYFNEESIKYDLVEIQDDKIIYKLKTNVDKAYKLTTKIISKYSNNIKNFTIKNESY